MNNANDSTLDYAAARVPSLDVADVVVSQPAAQIEISGPETRSADLLIPSSISSLSLGTGGALASAAGPSSSGSPNRSNA